MLKVLQKAYFDKVKLVYIDPPYNTGKVLIGSPLIKIFFKPVSPNTTTENQTKAGGDV